MDRNKKQCMKNVYRADNLPTGFKVVLNNGIVSTGYDENGKTLCIRSSKIGEGFVCVGSFSYPRNRFLLNKLLQTKDRTALENLGLSE